MPEPLDWVGPAIAALTLLTLLGVALRGAWRLGRKANHFLDDVQGTEARPGRPAVPGIVEQVAELRVRQEEIATVAAQAATDASAVRHELTRNGGDSTTKDIVHKALAAAEENTALLRRHMANGTEIMRVGLHNDAQIIAAIEALGGTVGPLLDYPDVDTGDDDARDT